MLGKTSVGGWTMWLTKMSSRGNQAGGTTGSGPAVTAADAQEVILKNNPQSKGANAACLRYAAAPVEMPRDV
ncbi:MAG: hypothetical protein ACAI35_06465 [Candidatus Methylacidiphilales bacterium]